MHPHAPARRLIVLLTMSLAACAPGGSPGPSSAPESSAAAATVGPSSSATPESSAAAITLPTCTDPYALPLKPAAQFNNVRGQPQASLRHVVATSTGALGFVISLPESGSVGPDDLGIVTGSHPIGFSFVDPAGVDIASDRLPVVTAAQASVRVGDGAGGPLAVTLAQDVTSALVPDVTANASIDMTVSWTDGCFTYRGDIAMTAQIVLAATVAACPTTDPGMRAAAEAIRHIAIQVGSFQQLLTAENWTARYADFSADEALIQFEGADFVRAPLKVRAGTSILVSEAAPHLSLGTISIQAYPLDQVLPDPAKANVDAVFNANGTARADGSVSVPVPSKLGKYVLELWTQWEASCLSGYGREWVTIQVT